MKLAELQGIKLPQKLRNPSSSLTKVKYNGEIFSHESFHKNFIKS